MRIKSILLLSFGILVALPAMTQIHVDKGVLQQGYDFQQLSVLIGDSTKVTQTYNGNASGPHYAVVYKAAEGDTVKYLMITSFYRKHQPLPPVDPGIPISVLAPVASSGVLFANGAIGGFDKGDWIQYDINFGKPRTKIIYEYAMSDQQGGGIQFRTNSTTGPIFAEVLLPVTGGWSTFKTIEINITPPYGTNGIASIFLTATNSPRTTGAAGNIKSIVIK